MNLIASIEEPALKVAIELVIIISITLLCIRIHKWCSGPKSKSPFQMDDRKKRKPYVVDQRRRDAVLKQVFSMKKVPQNLDAIIVGSGIGALSAGALLSKAGKRILILEQHDQAGGCCHTYIDKG